MNKRLPREGGAKATDWDAIKRRLTIAEQALNQGWMTASEKKKAILKARAHDLAAIRNEELGQEEAIDVLEFRLACEAYAVETSYVQEVLAVGTITPLPGTPAFIVGVVNVRGRIHSVMDLKQLFDIPAKGLGDLNRLIILKSGAMEFGILASLARAYLQ